MSTDARCWVDRVLDRVAVALHDRYAAVQDRMQAEARSDLESLAITAASLTEREHLPRLHPVVYDDDTNPRIKRWGIAAHLGPLIQIHVLHPDEQP